MRTMLANLRALAPRWLQEQPTETSVLIREPDADGHRHWIRVPDRDALLGTRRLTVVGFFGQARSDVDQTPIHELEEAIVDTVETIPGVLSYYDVALPGDDFGNLILCASPGAPTHMHDSELHRRAVELTPRHYHSARLHVGVVPGAFLSDADLVIERTRYWDYDDNPTWFAVREFVPR
jgi:hypothetical protein